MIYIIYISCIKVPTIPQGESAPSDVTCDGIPAGDWLTAICQSLGEVPAVYETSTDVHPLMVDLTAETSTETVMVPAPTAIASTTTSPGIEDEPSRTVDEVTARKSTEVLREWNLGDNLVVSLHRTEWKLHLHMRKNSQLIVMTIPTYCDFKNQLPTVGRPFERPSIICNNQLAVFAFPEKLILQQIFRFEHFKLKNTSLELDYTDESRLVDSFQYIDQAIKVAIFESVLPKQLVKMSDKKKPNSEPLDLLREFMLVINEEISRHVKSLFVCYGCKMSSPGQNSHECITVDYESQFSMVGEDSLLLIDPRRIANVLREKGILNHLNSGFFNLHKYDEIRSLMEM